MLTSFLRTSASSITWQACLPPCRAGSVCLLWECAWRISLFTNRKTDHTLYTASRPCRWHIHTRRLSQSSSSKVPIIFFMLPLSSRKSIQIHRKREQRLLQLWSAERRHPHVQSSHFCLPSLRIKNTCDLLDSAPADVEGSQCASLLVVHSETCRCLTALGVRR